MNNFRFWIQAFMVKPVTDEVGRRKNERRKHIDEAHNLGLSHQEVVCLNYLQLRELISQTKERKELIKRAESMNCSSFVLNEFGKHDQKMVGDFVDQASQMIKEGARYGIETEIRDSISSGSLIAATKLLDDKKREIEILSKKQKYLSRFNMFSGVGNLAQRVFIGNIYAKEDETGGFSNTLLSMEI
jgi:hypothetical protein